ncbi:hypothetical protein CR513_55498, partial [Mucuna pruriens]
MVIKQSKTSSSLRRQSPIVVMKSLGGRLLRRENLITQRVMRRFLSNLGKKHQEVVKWISKYLKGTAKRIQGS